MIITQKPLEQLELGNLVETCSKCYELGFHNELFCITNIYLAGNPFKIKKNKKGFYQ